MNTSNIPFFIVGLFVVTWILYLINIGYLYKFYMDFINNEMKNCDKICCDIALGLILILSLGLLYITGIYSSFVPQVIKGIMESPSVLFILLIELFFAVALIIAGGILKPGFSISTTKEIDKTWKKIHKGGIK